VVAAIHLADGVRSTVVKDIIEVFNFVFPFAVGALLTFWEKERFASVETAVDIG